MPTSQNGYSANDISVTSVRTIPGTDRNIRLRNGPAGDLLTWVLAQFHARVEDIDDGQLDDWGYAERNIRGSSTTLSNHASGTAADVNATKHPQGTSPSANFTKEAIAEIHAILAPTEGCVRWGGDYVPPAPKDGMHFEIVASESRCAAVLKKLTAAGGGAATTTGGGFDDVSLDGDRISTWDKEEMSLRDFLRNIQGQVSDIRAAHYGVKAKGTGDGQDAFGAYVFTDDPGTPQKRSIRLRDLWAELRNGAAQSTRISAVESKLDQVLALLQAKEAGK